MCSRLSAFFFSGFQDEQLATTLACYSYREEFFWCWNPVSLFMFKSYLLLGMVMPHPETLFLVSPETSLIHSRYLHSNILTFQRKNNPHHSYHLCYRRQRKQLYTCTSIYMWHTYAYLHGFINTYPGTVHEKPRTIMASQWLPRSEPSSVQYHQHHHQQQQEYRWSPSQTKETFIQFQTFIFSYTPIFIRNYSVYIQNR